MLKWTRQGIIRELLNREAAGLSLAPGGPDGCGSTLYQAATRIFGSWRNTLKAAGITPERAQLRDPWTPARIMSAIRALARRQRPPCSKALREQHSNLLHAARRCFGSWPRAVMAAGIDPTRFRRVTPWTKERILEAILQRALGNEPLGSQTVRPHTLSEAAVRVYGSWPNALLAAGLNPKHYLGRWPSSQEREGAGCPAPAPAEIAPSAPMSGATNAEQGASGKTPAASPVGSATLPRHSPLTGQLTQAIITRLRARKMMHATAVYEEDRPLYRAATKHHGSWRNALLAAGLNPDEFRVYGGRAVSRRFSRSPRCDSSVGHNP